MDDIEKILKQELGKDLQTGVSLDRYASIGTGGLAQFFYVASKIDDLVKAVSVAHKNNIPYFILGGGYNIVPSDQGFLGLVIKNESSNIAFSGDNSQVIVDSGVPLGKIINLAASRDLGGLEFLFGVPGTVGGAVYGNAGAFSFEIGDFVRSIILLIPKKDKMVIVKRGPEWMEFNYRTSKLKQEFQNDKYKPIILTVKFQLVRRRRDEILNLMQQNLKQKGLSQPLIEKSAGSYFKNIGMSKEKTAGFLLDSVGAKKMRVGGAAVSSKHANFLINRKNASSTDIRFLAEKLKEKVKSRYDVELKEEVEYIGKW